MGAPMYLKFSLIYLIPLLVCKTIITILICQKDKKIKKDDRSHPILIPQ